MRSAIVTSVFVFALLLMAVSTPVAASHSTDSGTAFEANVTVEQDPQNSSHVIVTVEFQSPASIEGLNFYLSDYVTVIDEHGFSTSDVSGGSTTQYSHHSGTTPSVKFSINTSSPYHDRFVGESDGAVFAETPYMYTTWQEDGSWHDCHLVGECSPVTVSTPDSDGYIGGGMMYLGDYTEYQHTTSEHNFRLIVPESATLEQTPETVLTSLEETSNRTQFQGEQNITFLLSPIANHGGIAYGGNGKGDVVVGGDEVTNSAYTSWAHEYIHTQQNHYLTDEMEWVDEGSAEYYAALLMYQQGEISKSEALSEIQYNQDISGSLSNKSTWSSSTVEYSRGERVVAALDMKIRNKTGGNKTYMDVVVRMNSYDHSIAYVQYQGIVSEVAGEDMDSWLDTHVRTDTDTSVEGWKDSIPDRQQSTESAETRGSSTGGFSGISSGSGGASPTSTPSTPSTTPTPTQTPAPTSNPTNVSNETPTSSTSSTNEETQNRTTESNYTQETPIQTPEVQENSETPSDSSSSTDDNNLFQGMAGFFDAIANLFSGLFG